MKMKKLSCGAVALAAVMTVTGVARAQEAWPAMRIRREPPARADLWQLTLGVRTALIRDAAFDRFSETDALPQLSLAGSRVVAAAGRLAFAAGLGLDLGGSDAQARNAEASLRLDRASLLLEPRYRFAPRAYAFARLAPGLIRATASVTDDATLGTFDQTFTLLSVDGSAGAALSLTRPGTPVGLWLVGEGGYGWTPRRHLVLSPHLGARDQDKAGDLDFGTLAPRGAFFRIALALGF